MSNLHSTRQSIILAALLVAGCEYAASTDREADHVLADENGDRVAAVVFDARRAPSDSALRAVHDLGATHLALVTFGFQEAAGDPHIRFSPDVRWYSESEDGARALAQRAAELDMGIILKPQIWLRGGAWSADIDFDSEKKWTTWEADYRAYLLHTARLAAEIDADLLIVGTELANPVRERPAFWRSLIAEIRSIYDGTLTYGANWHDDYLDVSFWDALDVIGVQAYFPLSSDSDPDLETIKRGWVDHRDALRRLSAAENRPVLFTEVGYRSVPYAAEEPWRWPSREEDVEPDYRLQADLYRGFFEAMWDRPWFGGAIIWKLYPQDRRRGRELDFTPQDKPAEEVLRTWFRRAAD